MVANKKYPSRPSSSHGAKTVSDEKRLLVRIQLLLNESTMGFLALTGLSLGVAAFIFNLPVVVENALDDMQWGIVGLFALEYAVNAYLSTKLRSYVLSPWRLLDALIILLSLLSLLPQVSDVALSAPSLRIARLFGIILFGPMVGHGLQQSADVPANNTNGNTSHIRRILGPAAGTKYAWDDLMHWIVQPSDGWLHVQDLGTKQLMDISGAVGFSHALLEVLLQNSSYPRIEVGSEWTVLALSLPFGDDLFRRAPVVVLMRENSVLSITQHHIELTRRFVFEGERFDGAAFAMQLIHLMLDLNEEMVGRIEHRIRGLEDMPARDSSDHFFQKTFRLKNSLSTAKGDMWRLRGLLQTIADGRCLLPSKERGYTAQAQRLAEDADYLYETTLQLRESLLSLIELHLNIAAHDTNRFMRLLAIVSTLAMVPTVIGSLFGMNLMEAPWPVTLGQVAFGTGVISLGILYVFLAKGWFK